jgi:biotin carboxylase
MPGRDPQSLELTMNILLLQTKFHLLPQGYLDAPEIERVAVITEPGHVQQYGPDADIHLVNSVHDLEQVRRATMEILSERELHGVLAPYEVMVPAAGYLRSYFGLPGVDFETANLFTNKYLMKRRAAAAGLPVTPFRVAYTLAGVDAEAERLGWPVVIKPVLGGGSIDVVILDSSEALARFATSPDSASIRGLTIPLIVEKYVEIEAEYTCNGIIHDGDVVFTATLKYPRPQLNCPYGFNAQFTLPPDHPDLPEILDLHERTVKAFGLRSGVTHMELLRSSTDLLVGEIACRPGGGGMCDGIQLQYGVDIWQALRETSLGLPPTVRMTERAGLVLTYQLPVKSGRIVALSAASEFEDIPGVLRVDMWDKVGDENRGPIGTSSATGVVYLCARDEAEISQRMLEILDRYVVEVEDEDAPAMAHSG